MTCETCQLDRAACTCFYILSLNWTRGEVFLTWWCPENSGYTGHIAMAGRYAKGRVEARRGYYDNRDSTLAIPCVVVDREAVLVVPDFALRKLVEDKMRFRPIVEQDEPCETCGNAQSRVMGLRIVDDGSQRKKQA